VDDTPSHVMVRSRAKPTWQVARLRLLPLAAHLKGCGHDRGRVVTGLPREDAVQEGAESEGDAAVRKIDERRVQCPGCEAADSSVGRTLPASSFANVGLNRALNKSRRKTSPGAVSDTRSADQHQSQEEQALATSKPSKPIRLGQSSTSSGPNPIRRSPHTVGYYLTTGNLVNQDVTQLHALFGMDPMYSY